MKKHVNWTTIISIKNLSSLSKIDIEENVDIAIVVDVYAIGTSSTQYLRMFNVYYIIKTKTTNASIIDQVIRFKE